MNKEKDRYELSSGGLYGDVYATDKKTGEKLTLMEFLFRDEWKRF